MASARNAARGGVQKSQHGGNISSGLRVLPRQGGNGAAGGVQGQALAVQQAVHLFDGAETLGRKAASAQTFKVQATHCQRVAIDHHERWHVLRNMAGKTGHDVRAHLGELVDAGQAADDGVVAHLHMAGQSGVVGQDGLVAHLAIVRNVDVGHHPVVVTDARDALVLRGAGVEGAKLADGVAVADHQARWFASVFFVLWRAAERGKLKNAVVLANAGVAL